MAAIALATVATLAPPYLAGRVVDDVINKRSTEQLDEIVLLMVGALVLGWLAVYAQTYPIGWVGQHALRDLRTRSSTTSRRSRSATSTATPRGR